MQILELELETKVIKTSFEARLIFNSLTGRNHIVSESGRELGWMIITQDTSAAAERDWVAGIINNLLENYQVVVMRFAARSQMFNSPVSGSFLKRKKLMY